MIGANMPLYEHVFISRQDLSNAQAEGLVEHFSTVLKDNGGNVLESEYWGVKTMAYKINKNRKGSLCDDAHRQPCICGSGNGTSDASARRCYARYDHQG
jgi:hypothetical protein